MRESRNWSLTCPGAVTRYGNQVPPYPETQSYVEKVRSTTELGTSAAGRETIYKTYEQVGGRRVPVYTNLPPVSHDADADYEIAIRSR